MTLFLLLVTIAAIIPISAVLTGCRTLGPTGTLVGCLLAIVLGVAQLIGHHLFTYAMLRRIKDDWRGEIVVSVYYLSILALGMLCGYLTLRVAQTVAGLEVPVAS